MKQLERLYERRMRSDALITPELAFQLTSLADDLHRKVAVLVNRRGHIDAVAVGDARRVYLPDPGRLRGAQGRLRGLRLIVATFTASDDHDPDGAPHLLSPDELTDLYKLRLDAAVAAEVIPGGRTGAISYAYLLPGALPEGSAPWAIETHPHISGLALDFGQFIQALESEFARKADRRRDVTGEPAVLIHLNTGERDSKSRRDEMLELCHSAGVHVLDTIEQRRPKVDPKYMVGQGKLVEVELRALELGAEILVFSRDLSPAQARSITAATSLKCLDRTQVILDIFAQRAQSHDGKLQVELAQLRYNLPKLTHADNALSRLGAGPGARGPGETKLEVDRRRARDRIRDLEKQLERLAAQRALRRRNRRDMPVISIVGYTNAGKSTLLNALTRSAVLSEDKLFATLDPTSRRLKFPRDREVIITDTVGFIRDLPPDLVTAFKATLEELEDADLLLHVVDASDPDRSLHIQAVNRILGELNLSRKPQILVLNKCDLLPTADADAIAHDLDGEPVSALKHDSLRDLLSLMERQLWREGLPFDPPSLASVLAAASPLPDPAPAQGDDLNEDDDLDADE
jgi:GTP-binding protein HflX